MRRNKRQGFQFSFGLKPQQENYSSRSTPKFPSIEINKNHLTSSQKKTYHFHNQTQPIEVRKLPLDLFMEIGGGIQLIQKKTKIKEKIHHQKNGPSFLLNDNLSVDSKDNKSVKSTKSLGQKFMKKNDRIVIEKTMKTNHTNKKHSNSLSNILELKLQSPNSKRKQQRRHLFGFKQSNFSLSKVTFEGREGKNENQDTLKLQNNLFQSQSTNIEFRQTKKMMQTFQRSKVHLVDREKSKVFKNFIHKPRPGLRFIHRGMNNQKIQSISRKFQDKN